MTPIARIFESVLSLNPCKSAIQTSGEKKSPLCRNRRAALEPEDLGIVAEKVD